MRKLTHFDIWEKCGFPTDDECWIYPQVRQKSSLPHTGDKTILEVLLNFEGFDVPSGMEWCHTCDTTLCVNLNHTYLGTHADNMLDMRIRMPWYRYKLK